MVLQSSGFSRKLSYYQSANKDNDTIKSNFIVRIAEYQTIINSLSVKKKVDPLQHELILGRRGSGKSTLLKRIQIELQENTNLSTKYLAINLAEEQSSIYRLFDLWLEIIKELEDCFNYSFELKDYSSFNSDETYTRYLFEVIHNYIDKKDKKLVLLLDNFDRIIENFSDDGNLLREILINYNDIQIIGGSTRMNEHFWKYDLPFYEFFRIHRLQSLSTKEMIKLILHWSETLEIKRLKTFAKHNRGKIEAIRILTDGLPRTLQFFIEILLDNSYLYGYEYLKDIMDKVTPVYQERLNTLTPPLRKIIAEMAFLWEASSTKQLVDKCRMPSKTISAYLKTLIDKGIVTKIETGSKNHLYRISERFFNMWFIVTQGSPSEKRKAKWLSIFLENWYEAHEFKKLTQTHIDALKHNKIPYDKALPLSKGLIHSKHITISERDTIIDLVENLQTTKKDSLIQLPKKNNEIFTEVTDLFENKKYDDAIKIVNTIENEADGYKFYLLGFLYNKCKKLAEAEKFYLMAIEKGNEEAIFDLAYLYSITNRPELAIKYYLMAVEKGHEDGMYNLAILYKDSNRIKLAEKYYLMAIEKDHAEAMNNLALLYQNNKKLELAEKYYLMAIEKKNNKAINNLALFYLYENRNKKEALSLIKKCNKDKLNLSEYNYNLVLIEIWNGIFNDVENRLQQAISKGNKNNLYYLFEHLLVHQLYQIVYNLFNKYDFSQNLKDQYKVIYYIVLLKVRENPKKILLSIPPELNETIQSFQGHIRERQEFYGYV